MPPVSLDVIGNIYMKIRKEKISEIGQITEIHNQAFNGPDEGRIVENLRKNGNLTQSIICEINGELVGHIAYSPLINNCNEVIGIGLAPVAVRPSFQNQGIGSELIKSGNQKAFDLGFRKIFVLGDPNYYSRFGFVLARDFNYYCGFDPDGNHFMVLGAKSKELERTIVDYGVEFNT